MTVTVSRPFEAQEVPTGAKSPAIVQISIKEGNNELISMINMGRFDAEAFEEYLNGDIMDRLINGLHFQNIVPEGFMAIKQDIKVAQKNAKMLVVGRLFRDYSRFYSLIKE